MRSTGRKREMRRPPPTPHGSGRQTGKLLALELNLPGRKMPFPIFWGAFSLIEGQKRLSRTAAATHFYRPLNHAYVPAASECKLRSTLEQFLLLSLWTMFEEEVGWVGHALQEQAWSPMHT